jgi:hypothetical protein
MQCILPALQVLCSRSMLLMADLGDDTTRQAETCERVLCVLRTHADSGFDMTPGFSEPGQPKYRFEDNNGAQHAVCIYTRHQSTLDKAMWHQLWSLGITMPETTPGCSPAAACSHTPRSSCWIMHCRCYVRIHTRAGIRRWKRLSGAARPAAH